MDAGKKKREPVRAVRAQPPPNLVSGRRPGFFALPLSQRRPEMAVNHRVVSLRVEGPPARKASRGSRRCALGLRSLPFSANVGAALRAFVCLFFCVASWAGSSPSEARRLAGWAAPQRARAAPTRAPSSLFEFPAGTGSARFSGGGRKPRCRATS